MKIIEQKFNHFFWKVLKLCNDNIIKYMVIYTE
jgi:hypothetical protein